jgi:hypothetical protein
MVGIQVTKFRIRGGGGGHFLREFKDENGGDTGNTGCFFFLKRKRNIKTKLNVCATTVSLWCL